MTELTLTLSDEMHSRLQEIAERAGHSVDECARMALAEFLVHWETHLHDVEDLADDRPALRVVNE